MRAIVRNSVAHETVLSEHVAARGEGCAWCGQVRGLAGPTGRAWLYRFHVSGDTFRTSGPIVGGELFCSRSCGEAYLGQNFDETKG